MTNVRDTAFNEPAAEPPPEAGFVLSTDGLAGIEPVAAAAPPRARVGTQAVVPGGSGDDSLVGTGSADLLTGAEGNDTLSGLAGNDTLDGGIGDDSLVGGTGNDSLVGADGADTLFGGTGIDTMDGGAGNDTYLVDAAGDSLAEAGTATTEIDLVRASVDWTLGANFENLVLTGTGAIDGTGNERANVLTGNAAGNLLSGADGDDTLNGGSGGADILFGGGGNDSLVGGSADDTLDGGGGRDTLNGGAGVDSLGGGDGNDTYLVDVAGDVVNEFNAAPTQIDTVRAALSWTLGANLERLVLTGTLASEGTGNALDNVLTGNAAGNALYGLAGADTLNGGGGADTLVGGDGNDRYLVDQDGDIVSENSTLTGAIDTVSALINYTLGANLEYLELAGSADLTGTGNALANALTGNGGANLLSGASGNDTLDGGDGNDTLHGGSGIDSVTGGAGSDALLFASLMLGSLVDYDRVGDFLSGTDDLVFDNSLYLLDNDADLSADVLVRAAPGGWGSASEVVIFTTNVTGSILSTGTAIAAAGAAMTAIAVGDRKVFAIDNGAETSVWLFHSDAANATVAATELTLVAYLTTTPSTSSLDYLLVA